MSDDHLAREIDEELRREQLKKLWDRYGLVLIAAAVLIVGGTAGYRGYEAWQVSRSAEVGDRYLEAVTAANEERFAEAETVLGELSRSGVGDYAVLARMRVAALAAENGQREAALAGFEAVAEDRGADRVLRDLARLRAAHLLIETAGYDEIKERAESLATADGTWRHFAREILGLSAYRAGDSDAARVWFQALTADRAAPQNARARAELVLSVIGTGPDTPPAPETGTETQ